MIQPSASVSIEQGGSAQLSYTLSPAVDNPMVAMTSLPDGLQATVTPAPDKQSGTILLSVSNSTPVGLLQTKIVAAAGSLSAMSTLSITVVKEGTLPPPTPPTPGEAIDRRPVRTIKLVEDGTKSYYAWFEYNGQNKATKATLQDNKGNKATFNYSYPTASSIVVNSQEFNMSTSFFSSEGRLVSISESDGDRMVLTYDTNGHITSFDGKTCMWTGEDMTSMISGSSTLNIKPSARNDNNGVSFLIAVSDGDMEDLYMYPVLAPSPGINSAHLPASLTYQNNFTVNFAYEVDSKGCIKSITTDNGQVFYIWYKDEAESSDEKPAVDPVTPPSGDIKTVTGAQFLAATPSQAQLYRLTGAIDEIYNAEYGDFFMKTADGERINIYGASSSAIGYNGSNDKTFPNKKLRKGDEVTMVGYRGDFKGSPEMEFGYVEDYYRLQASDFVGTYTYWVDMIEKEEKPDYLPGAQISTYGSFLVVHGLDGYFDEHDTYWSSAAYAVYDDNAGTVTLLGGYSNGDWAWYFTNDESQNYLSYFFPVIVDFDNDTITGRDAVKMGDLLPYGIMVLWPRSELRGSAGFGLERSGEPSDYIYIVEDYLYDKESDTVGDYYGRGPVLRFWFMTKQQGSTSSVSKRNMRSPVRISSAEGLDKVSVRRCR